MLQTAQRTTKLKRKKRASASLGEAAADKTTPPHERFFEAFRWMLLARTLEEKLVSLYRGGQITGGVYIGKGQEAVSVACGLFLEKGDIFAPLIRDQAGRSAFGEPLVDVTRTYLGSRLHFMTSLYDSIVNDEGFTVEKLDASGKGTKGTFITDLYDSSIYHVDSNTVEIDWDGHYRISYKSVLPDKKFLEEFKLPANSRMQVTLLDVNGGFFIEENGYFYEQLDVISTGYWAWKKIAESLPYDYVYE